MKFSALESDLLGDLAQDTHGIWEIFEFVRLRNPTTSEGETFETGLAPLRSWLDRGWLCVSSTPLYPSSIQTPLEALSWLDRKGLSAIRYVRNAPSIDLSSKTIADNPWVAGAR
jgi:hypothetical protein